jgi:hypothetical protein
MTRRPLWWVLARGWGLLWAVPLVLLLAAAQVVLPSLFTAPALRAALPVSAPTALVAGTLIALLSVLTVDEPGPHVRSLSTRPRRMLGPARVTLLLLTANLLVAAAAPTQAPVTLAVTSTIAGEALTIWALLGRFTWVIPAVHTTASLLLGATTFDGLAWWAWPANPHPTSVGFAASTALLALGLSLAVWRTSRTTAWPPTAT